MPAEGERTGMTPTTTTRLRPLEVHREIGPPRVTAVLAAGQLVCELEVAGGGSAGSARLRDGRSWSITQPPASGEWWVLGSDGRVTATLTRHRSFGAKVAIACGDGTFDLVPVGGWWRRRWEIRERGSEVVLVVRQRVFARSVHELHIHRGDLPTELVWIAAWWLAARTSRDVVATRRSRWGPAGS